MRLAFFSPLNPQRSGISDYSEDLLPFLSPFAEIDLFIAAGVTPTNPAIIEKFAIFPHTEFARQRQRKRYDLCLYQMGNNTDYHTYMADYLQTYPGIVTLHDYVLHHFYATLFLQGKRYDEYQTAMETYYGNLGRISAEQFRQGIISDYLFCQVPFYQPAVNPSLGIVAHSSYVKAKLLQYNPAYRVAMINMGILPPKLADYPLEDLRRKHRLPPDSFVIASFGFVSPGKRIHEILRAFARFVKHAPDALCLFVGEELPVFNVRPFIHELALDDKVIITGYTPYQDFLEYIALSDVCVNLRHPTVRATSANLLKIMAFAKPVLASDLCELLDLPAACCLKIPLNDTEEARLLQAFQTLYTDRAYGLTLGKAARTFIEEHHSMPQAAEKYIAFCTEIINNRTYAVPPSSPP